MLAMGPGARATDLAIAQELTRRILQALGGRVHRIILFGSRARGEARPDSDFDLLVVLRDLTPRERRPLRLSLYRALRPPPIRLGGSCWKIVTSRSPLARYSSLFRLAGSPSTSRPGWARMLRPARHVCDPQNHDAGRSRAGGTGRRISRVEEGNPRGVPLRVPRQGIGAGAKRSRRRGVS
jgi:hypothetical protein